MASSLGHGKVPDHKEEERRHTLSPKTEGTDNEEGIKLGENHCSTVCE